MVTNNIKLSELSEEDIINKLLDINRNDDNFRLSLIGNDIYRLHSEEKSFFVMPRTSIYKIDLRLNKTSKGMEIIPEFKGNTFIHFYMLLGLGSLVVIFLSTWFFPIEFGMRRYVSLIGLLPALVLGSVNQHYIRRAQSDFEKFVWH